MNRLTFIAMRAQERHVTGAPPPTRPPEPKVIAPKTSRKLPVVKPAPEPPCVVCATLEAPPEVVELPIKRRPSGRPPKGIHPDRVVKLLEGSNPSPCFSLFDDTVDGARRLYCRRYVNCLDYAYGLEWDSFECRACTVDESISMAEWRDDFEGLAGLLKAISGS